MNLLVNEIEKLQKALELACRYLTLDCQHCPIIAGCKLPIDNKKRCQIQVYNALFSEVYRLSASEVNRRD